jgi:NitT/TauT family transport system substrate-binding protein
MKNLLKVILGLTVASGILLAGCATTPTAQSGSSTVTPAAATQSAVDPTATTEVANATAAVTPKAETDGKLTIYAPASTSSIPVILAAKKTGVNLVLYTNQSQANTLLLRGEAPILVTGLSVGVDLFKNGAPVSVVNTYVTGLSYLVTYGKAVNGFADLKGEQIYIPFEGSPIEEASAYLAGKEGLTWKKDISPVYSPFDASVALLKQGKIKAVVLPEPTVSLVEGQPNIFISLSMYDAWNKNNPNDAGYPQVGTFVNADWAKTHTKEVEQFNQALAEAITSVQQDPAAAIEVVKANFKLSAAVLEKSLSRTHYQLKSGVELQQTVENYYKVIGKPLDEKFSGFYYLPAK